MARPRNKQSRGFTLIELMIVISIILILVAVAVPLLQWIRPAGQRIGAAAKSFHSAFVISQYTLDKQKAPQSLDDLTASGIPQGNPK